MNDSKKTALDFLREAYKEMPKDPKSVEAIELKEAEIDSTNPFEKILRGYERIAKLEKNGK